MIISCTSCYKKFEISSNLIPDSGRLLACSSCNNQWFFTKEKSQVFIKQEIKEKKITPQNIRETKINVNLATKKPIKKNDKVELKDKLKENNSIDIDQVKKKTTNNKFGINFLNLILVFIISAIALIVLVDTFKSPISLIVPNTEIILYNLYETLRDIIFFFKDLIK